MKTHAIIPIFLPHIGCPHNCVFCNQRTITARQHPPTGKQMRDIIDRNLSTIAEAGIEIHNREIAFFGGSFTGIPLKMQQEYLSIASEYKSKGKIGKIRLSTRPDYIDEYILSYLREYTVDLIELGVQSFNPEVLRMSCRGHDRDSIYESSFLIKENGIQLGIQLMVGLPGTSYERDIDSARETVKISPDVTRLYPTVILHGTRLHDLYLSGAYKPLPLEEMVKTVKDMYRIIDREGINIIRVGLKSTDLINDSGIMSASGYHPAFRQLVEGEIAREDLESQLIGHMNDNNPVKVEFLCNTVSFSNMVGNKKSNRIFFNQKYPKVQFKFRVDNNLPKGTYIARIMV
ncbi:MAG: elongator complex protein 3 [Anaerovoracaceae bacterium]